MFMAWRGGSRVRKLLFEHVPKCAGTAAMKYLERQYARRRTYTVYDRRPNECETFQRMPADERHRYDLVIGHGAHRLLDWCAPDAVTATVLRQPVDRIVSHYYYVLEQHDHHLHDTVVGRKMSLRDYVESGVSDELRNYMTCRFLGVSPTEAERDPGRSVDRAWEILQSRYRVVGVVERLPPAMEAIRTAIGATAAWTNTRTNTTVGRRPIDSIAAEDRRAIADRNALDVELYRRAAEAAPS
jgi:hypothetical protein